MSKIHPYHLLFRGVLPDGKLPEELGFYIEDYDIVKNIPANNPISSNVRTIMECTDKIDLKRMVDNVQNGVGVTTDQIMMARHLQESMCNIMKVMVSAHSSKTLASKSNPSQLTSYEEERKAFLTEKADEELRKKQLEMFRKMENIDDN